MGTPTIASNKVQATPGGRGPASSGFLHWLKPSPTVTLVSGSLASGLALWLCYYPAACSWLAWFALVPLLPLVRSRLSARRVYPCAWLAGLVFFWLALQWMRVADARMYYTWASLATYCSLYFPVAIFLLRRLEKHTRLPLIVTLPAVWTGLEYVRAHLMTGFAWYFLAHTQHQFLPVVQVADLGGAYAVTFLVALVNALVFEILYAFRWYRAYFSLPAESVTSWRWRLSIYSAIVLGFGGAVLAYGFWRLGQTEFAAGPRLALLQGNLDQRIRNAVSDHDPDDALKWIDKHYNDLAQQAIEVRPRPDLIVWPETSFPHDWRDLANDYPLQRLPTAWQTAITEWQKRGSTAGGHWHDLIRYALNPEAFAEVRALQANVLLGMNSSLQNADGTDWRYNSAVLLQANQHFAGRYDKIHRVPFGEYVPLRDWLPWMNTFAPYDFDYSIHVGRHLTRFALEHYHFGVIICFEDTDPDLARQYVRPANGEQTADFLVNTSNDGWFNGSSEHEEHLAICRFRAIECRRAVARAVNMGISAVIDGNGRMVALPGASWQQSKKIAGVVTATVPIDRRRSLYAAWGDWLPGCCWLILALGLIRTLVRPEHRELTGQV